MCPVAKALAQLAFAFNFTSWQGQREEHGELPAKCKSNLINVVGLGSALASRASLLLLAGASQADRGSRQVNFNGELDCERTRLRRPPVMNVEPQQERKFQLPKQESASRCKQNNATIHE